MYQRKLHFREKNVNFFINKINNLTWKFGGAEATKLELLIIKFIENLRKPEIYDATRMIDFRKLSIKIA